MLYSSFDSFFSISVMNSDPKSTDNASGDIKLDNESRDKSENHQEIVTVDKISMDSTSMKQIDEKITKS